MKIFAHTLKLLYDPCLPANPMQHAHILCDVIIYRVADTTSDFLAKLGLSSHQNQTVYLSRLSDFDTVVFLDKAGHILKRRVS